MIKQQKRYQYWSPEEIKWTQWFNSDDPQEQWQLKPKLKNEYRIIQDEDNN